SQYTDVTNALSKLMVQLKLQSIRGTSKEVYVGDIEASQATVIVRLDLSYVGANTRVIPNQYMSMSLAKLDGVWKVDNLELLPFDTSGGASSTSSSPGSTVPSSVPDSSSSSG